MSNSIEDASIMIEFAPLQQTNQPGIQEVGIALPSGKILAEKSAQAINSAMKTMQNMAGQVITTMNELPVSIRPSQTEVEFGINLNVEGNAAIAKAVTQSNIKVKFIWQNQTTNV